MMMTGPLPASAPEKLALLKKAAAWGDRLRPVLAAGTPVHRLREIAGSEEGLTVTDSRTGLLIRLGDHVYWDVTVNDDDIVTGYAASGYGDLMDLLRIDLAGRPHVPGNGL
jgi:hypothetical protein